MTDGNHDFKLTEFMAIKWKLNNLNKKIEE